MGVGGRFSAAEAGVGVGAAIVCLEVVGVEVEKRAATVGEVSMVAARVCGWGGTGNSDAGDSLDWQAARVRIKIIE
jgi:hypothetical protein